MTNILKCMRRSCLLQMSPLNINSAFYFQTNLEVKSRARTTSSNWTAIRIRGSPFTPQASEGPSTKASSALSHKVYPKKVSPLSVFFRCRKIRLPPPISRFIYDSRYPSPPLPPDQESFYLSAGVGHFFQDRVFPRGEEWQQPLFPSPAASELASLKNQRRSRAFPVNNLL